MTLSQNSANMLRKLLEVVADISAVVTLRFTPTHMRLQTMDASHVSLVDLRLTDSWFETYKCPKDVNLSTSLPMLVKMLACIETGQRAWLRTVDTKTGPGWELELSGGESTFTKTFEMPKYNLDDELLELPDNEADVDFVMNATRWAKTIDELKFFGEVLKVTCGEDGTMLHTEDTTQNVKMSCLIGMDDVESYDACDEEFETFFPIGPIQRSAAGRHAACLGPVATVAIHITEGRPIDMVFDLGNGAESRFIVAPRIDGD